MCTIGLIHLPEDILLEITSYLSVVDVLSLKQTCRTLHAFGSSDYLWHRIIQNVRLPLDIPPEIPPSSLSYEELQRTAIKAMRLEANWSSKTPAVKRVKQLTHDESGSYVEEMHLLPGGRWLLTAQRVHQLGGRWCSPMSLWSIEDVDNVYRVASFEVSGFYRSSAIQLIDEGRSAIVAVGTHDREQTIEVFRIPLQGSAAFSYHFTATPSASYKLHMPLHPQIPQSAPVIHELAVGCRMVAVTALIPGAGRPLQVLLWEFDSGACKWVNPQRLESFSIMWLRLYAGYILLLGMTGVTLVLQIYQIPRLSRSRGLALPTRKQAGPLDDEFINLEPTVYQSEQQLVRDAEYQDIGKVSFLSPSVIAILIFYTFRDTSPAVGQVVRFSLPFCGRRTEGRDHRRSFTMPREVSAQLAQVGPMGRAVWLEHNWETQQRRIMRYQPGGSDPLAMLLPHDPALPFSPNICHSLAFDEAAGRLCLGLFNGDIYLLDFV